MTTAIIYSGQARSFAQLLENHAWHLLRKLPNPEIYVSVEDDEDSRAMERLRELPYPVHIEYHKQPEMDWSPPVEPRHLAGYDRSVPVIGVFRQFWAMRQAWDFYQAKEFVHTFVVRVRPDTKFLHMDLTLPQRGQVCVPWYDSWGGINDRFALMSGDVAPSYFAALDALRASSWDGSPFHPEKALAEAVRDFQVVREPYDFVTLRKNGDVVPIGANLCDLARMLSQKR